MAVLTRYQNWAADEVKVLADRAKTDLWNPRIHGIINLYVDFHIYYPLLPLVFSSANYAATPSHVVCGQKPQA